jgi:hypothetical protein
MRPLIFGLLLISAAGSAQAQQPRSVEYFIMHNAERQQMHRSCSGGIVQPLAHAECINAQQADYYIYAAQAQQHDKQIGNFLEDPHYYAEHPLARMQALRECVTPSSALRYTAAECQAARNARGN